ncbi:NAD(P)-dependent alcohol dehydrogenase [Actinoplanes couchii]|uniref:NADPH:quinone reductase n=1 Tax=Actinoplanes couchii TaxID=403638 RepID=A0ABQ3XH42_9ACTN|nr:NAD(P)-dependent alcohol dehydrogenase [Actinoplanes couchii]MDR6320692.1 NADPH:quinone reductase-like Zn-dependent oxidoreductase [Actinoplanes couchii]GID57822.1 NADPH:quinone reductase [Actinoplanes couchii]
MKAITRSSYGSADVLELRDVDPPPVADDEVLIEVRAAAVDPGVWIMMTGRPWAVRLASGPRRPRVPILGLDVAGVISRAGARITRFRPGDEVYGTCRSGSFAEFATAREKQLARKPPGISFAGAAVVPVSGVTALQTVRQAGVQSGQRVLITGAGGGVGSFAVQLAKIAGASVTGVCSPAKAELVRSLGADQVIDYTSEEIDRDGPAYDVIVDLAGSRPLPLLRRAAKPRAVIALVGGGHAEGRVMGGFHRLMAAPLISLFMPQKLKGVTSFVRVPELETLTAHIESGAVTPVVGATYPLAEAAEALRDHATSRSAGKIALEIRH